MKLRQYQEEGVTRLLELTAPTTGTHRRRDALLADEPGLGKTIQIIELINRIAPSSVIIVCPASLRINWKKELATWLRVVVPTLRVLSYEGAQKELYHSDQPFDLAVFDEAHYLKNPNAKRTRCCLNIPAIRRVFVTGTPVVNRPVDLFPILHSMGMKYDYVAFGLRYCAGFKQVVRWHKVTHRPMKTVWNFSGASHTDELGQNLRKWCMVRRLKSDVLGELPEKFRQVIELNAPHGEPLELRDAVKKMFDGLDRAAEELAGAKKIAFQQLAKHRLDTGLHKLPYVIDFIKLLLEEEQKVVVFAYHREVVDILAEQLPDAVKLYGGMTDAQKDEAVLAFQRGSARVFVGQITAAGTGITLTASSTVVFAELDWVPGNVTQAEDRCHRMGQKNPVRVIHLVCTDSVDCLMVKTVVSKQLVIEECVENEQH